MDKANDRLLIEDYLCIIKGEVGGIKMIVGCVKEIKVDEYRVGLTPAHAYEYIQAGHQVVVETQLGQGSGFDDSAYQQVGAKVLKQAQEVWQQADMMIKVKEPQPSEYAFMRENQLLFTYLHLADNKDLTQALCRQKVKAVAYETVVDNQGRLPLLKPMSEVAGRLAIQAGAKYLEKATGGKGVLLSGVTGVKSGHVVIVGGGVVGFNACKAAIGLGATVSVLDRNLDRLAYIEDVFNGQVQTIFSDQFSLERELAKADLVVCSVLLPGDKAPKIITRHHLKIMQPGSVIVDVAIDQGGCCETSRPTTHQQPIYEVDGIIHYCVSNMPGVVPQTATFALGNATLPYGLMLANLGLEAACQKNQGIYQGVNVYQGHITHQAVAKATGLAYVPLKTVLGE